MKKIKKSTILIIVIVVIVIASAILIPPFIKPTAIREESVDYETVKPIIDNGIVLFLDSRRMIFDGEAKEGSFTPFLEDGVMLVAVDEICGYLGGSFTKDEASKVITTRINGCTAQFMLGFNIIVLNNEPIIMLTKPVEKDGHIYLPTDIVAKALNINCFRDYSQGIAVFRASKQLSQQEYYAILEQMGLKQLPTKTNSELDEIAKKVIVDDLYTLSRTGRMYVSDGNGRLFSWVLMDDFSIRKKEQFVSVTYPQNSIFFSGEGKERKSLYINGLQEYYGKTADVVNENDLLFAVSSLVEQKQKDNKSADISVYRDAITDTFVNDDFKALKEQAVNNGKYDDIIGSKGSSDVSAGFSINWKQICATAKCGDILLFRNKESNNKFGFFNHAALVISSSAEANEIKVLQARSPELGVGSDSMSDSIRLDSFKTVQSYWNIYDIVVLCSVDGVDEQIGKEIATEAYNIYKDYKFGYGGFYGAKETTCAELINNAFKLRDIVLVNNSEYQSKLKKALDGNPADLVILPDDVVLSDKVRVDLILER